MIIWQVGPELVWSETTGLYRGLRLADRDRDDFFVGLFAAAAN